ncbi:YbaB/EbfC family nucleoid-associated protein [Nonomuraea cavernae]|uniref:YbaB/EbfC family nucleoid-associated protein n=1 Tax=Nonomuraea cavernae TaxID=2045107 RepID=UPI00360ECE1B
MTSEFISSPEALAVEYDRHLKQVADAYGELNELTVSTRSDDGMITVTVGPRGQVRKITLNPRVSRVLEPSELAQALMEQIGQAASAVAERSRELLDPLLPDDLPYGGTLGDHPNLAELLPRPGAR